MSKINTVFFLLFAAALAGLPSAGMAVSGTESLSAAGTASSGAEELSEAGTETDEEDYSLTIPLIFENHIPGNAKDIEAKGQEMIYEKIGIRVQIVSILRPINGDARREAELSLLEKSGTDFDIVNVFTQDAECMDLTRLLQEYGSDILDLFAEQNQDLLDGRDLSYIPSLSDYTGGHGIAMRQDILDKYDIDTSALKSLEDFDALFEKLAEQEPGMKMIVNYRTGHSMFYEDDVGAFPDTIFRVSDEDGSVVSIYSSDEYRSFVQLQRSWFESGYTFEYMALQDISAPELVRSDGLFSYMCAFKPGIEAETSAECGIPMTVVPISSACVTSNTMRKSGWGITSECRHPEEAMKLLNLFYTDPDLENLFANGIEGENYRVDEDGYLVALSPDGTDGGTQMNDASWLLPNQYLTGLYEGDDPQHWEKLKEFNTEAVSAVNLGFVFDDSAVADKNAELNAIVSEYSYGLETGQLDPDIYLPLMLQKLQDAGEEDVRQELQKQYSAWTAENKNRNTGSMSENN